MVQKITLCHPEMSEAAISAVCETLRTQWIGQGPKVDAFEAAFQRHLGLPHTAIAVGAGTDALHLAYVLAGIGPDDEVIAPVLTCAATNIPLLYQRARVRFADVQRDSLNMDPRHVEALVTDRTKAIVCVDFAGLPCDLEELRAIADRRGVPLIEDAAQALGATYHGKSVGAVADFAIFSFQAVKNLTTGDGGMLLARDPSHAERARRLRWFGIDRTAKLGDRWLNDIHEIGFKYQMTDIAASLGLAGLLRFEQTLAHRRSLFEAYRRSLKSLSGVELVGAKRLADREHAACNCTVVLDDASDLRRRLAEQGIESGVMHQRNDRYSIFADCRGDLPVMDSLEGRYLMLPLHTKMTIADVERICEIIRR